METKPIGKIKNGGLFRYEETGKVYQVTGSGFGRPHVEFKEHPNGKDTFTSCQKKDHVIIVRKSSLQQIAQ